MANTKTVGRLETQLAECENGSNNAPYQKIDLLNDLAWALRDTDLQRAQSLSEEAKSLAESPGDGSNPYHLGLAKSLRTLGYLDFRLGNYARSFSQSLEAQQRFESLGRLDDLPDVFENIASVYTHMGDVPNAFDYFYKQLDIAQRLDDKVRIINASNNLAALHHDTGDIDRAIETYRKNLETAAVFDDQRLLFFCYYNLAICYLHQDDAEQALDCGRTALRISREEGFALFEIYALTLIGEAYLKKGDKTQAFGFLKQALTLSEKLDAKHVATNILWSLAQAYFAQQDFDDALNYLDQNIALANSIDDKREIAKPHLLASEIYEERGDFAQALEHYRQYQTYREAELKDRADQQLQILQVVHETESARRQTEELQEKAVALQEAHDLLEQRVQERTTDLNHTVELLQEEVDERRRVEVELQHLTENLEDRLIARTRELAAFFDLATLNSSDDDLPRILSPAITHILSAGHCHAFCLHLFDSDTQQLRLVTTDGISPAQANPLQSIPIVEPFEERFNQAGGHLATTELPHSKLLPEALKLPGFQSYLGTQLRTQGRTLGWLSCYRRAEDNFSLDEISLMVALAEQLAVIIENHRLREQAEAMAVLEERQRLARDLHDSVNQSLYGLTLLARSGAEAAAEGNTARLQTSLADLETSAFQALREMRLLLFQLRPEALDQIGLVEALMLRLNTIERRSGMTATYEGIEAVVLPPETEAELYHLAMEALNNALKHAQANRVAVFLTVENDLLTLVISDDGRGFDLSATSGGLGVQNIRERAARLQAQLEITTKTDGGAKIEVSSTGQPSRGRTMTDLIRILIADDHVVVRRGLASMLVPSNGMVVIGEAGDGLEVVEMASELQPDVILMDMVMPGQSGVEAITIIKTENPDARILVLTSFGEEEKIAAAIKAGALGYLLKDSSSAELLQAIRTIAAGNLSLPQPLALKLMQGLQESADPETLSPLTKREDDVLQCLARGLSNQDIAAELHISVNTVRSHVSHILAKLHLANRAQAARYALEHNLFSS